MEWLIPVKYFPPVKKINRCLPLARPYPAINNVLLSVRFSQPVSCVSDKLPSVAANVIPIVRLLKNMAIIVTKYLVQGAELAFCDEKQTTAPKKIKKIKIKKTLQRRCQIVQHALLQTVQRLW